jgi:hypothetical protein
LKEETMEEMRRNDEFFMWKSYFLKEDGDGDKASELVVWDNEIGRLDN